MSSSPSPSTPSALLLLLPPSFPLSTLLPTSLFLFLPLKPIDAVDNVDHPQAALSPSTRTAASSYLPPAPHCRHPPRGFRWTNLQQGDSL
ncbi:hypothetical protein B0H14DRAFT_2670198 [Mycena olivaceomarginata]|nr:hypothetical protein B0H14DRAFT_2670198 [Mycena olivaceomarginata]